MSAIGKFIPKSGAECRLKPYLAARWDQKQMRWDEEEDDMEWLFR